ALDAVGGGGGGLSGPGRRAAGPGRAARGPEVGAQPRPLDEHADRDAARLAGRDEPVGPGGEPPALGPLPGRSTDHGGDERHGGGNAARHGAGEGDAGAGGGAGEDDTGRRAGGGRDGGGGGGRVEWAERGDAMPMHDWTRVPAGTYHDFHCKWLADLSNRLNTGLLPDDHESRVEAVLTGTTGDNVVLREVGSLPEGGEAPGLAVATAP